MKERRKIAPAALHLATLGTLLVAAVLARLAQVAPGRL
jgi:hypothetical protein